MPAFLLSTTLRGPTRAASVLLLLALAACCCPRSLRAAPSPTPPASTISVAGADGWIFLDKELRHLRSPKFWADPGGPDVPGDPLPAILDFKQQLDKAGVDLLVVPVPAKAAIYPEKTPSPAIPGAGATDREFYKALEARGIKVLDLTDTFLAARDAVPLYCRQDSHWSPDGIRIAAAEIAGRLRELPRVKAQPKIPMTSQVLPLAMTGDLASPGNPPETLNIRRVSEAGSGQPVPPSKTSPVILLGDSHNLIFHAGGDMHATGAGLPDQLALELGFPVDVVAVRGSGATPARRNLARRKDNLAGRQAVVWCFSAREFTEGQGWAKVQVVKNSATPSGPEQ